MVSILALLVLAQLIPVAFTAVSAIILWPADQVQRWLRESESTLPYWFRDRASLVAEVEQWRRQVRIAETHTPSFARLQAENQRLRQLTSAGTTTVIMAGVVSLPPTLPYDVLQLDQGSVAGIVVGAPIFVGNGAVIGTVEYVAPRYSIARLVSSPGFFSTVYITGANTFASLEGVGGGVARVRVPQGVTLSIDDVVVLVGSQSGQYGVIEYIESEPTQPEQFGYVMPVQPLRGMHTVAVGTVPVETIDIDALHTILLATSTRWYLPKSSGTSDSVASSTIEVDTIPVDI